MLKRPAELMILASGLLLLSSLSRADPDITFDFDLIQKKTGRYVENTTENVLLAEDIAKEIVFLSAEQIAQIPDKEMEKIVADLTYISQFDAGGVSAGMALGHIGPRAKCSIPVLLREMKLSEELEKLDPHKSGIRPYKFYYGAVQKIEPGLLTSSAGISSVISDFRQRNPECKTV